MSVQLQEMSLAIPTRLADRFVREYGTKPQVFRAPGRVNLIGEHTDYNDGFVMPAAIQFYAWVAVAPRTDRKFVIYSQQFEETVQFELNELDGPGRNHWSDYVRGVAALLLQRAPFGGANLMVSSEVPLGSGLSSSAALEVSSALAIASVAGISPAPMELARLCQRAEHEFAGTHCGIMDQFISTFAQAGRALMLDCRSLDCTLLPLPGDVRVVICNTEVRHELASSEYNRRRADCNVGVETLSQYDSKITALRDVTPDMLERHKAELSDAVYRHCRHVVAENERVLAAASALTAGDVGGFGELMFSSHESLRDDYEVSCEELDLMVEMASNIDGVHGARMTGGGFGGCTVNLVDVDAVDDFKSKIEEMYRAKTGKTPPVYICSPAAGAGQVEI